MPRLNKNHPKNRRVGTLENPLAGAATEGMLSEKAKQRGGSLQTSRIDSAREERDTNRKSNAFS
jgi:hypothetical protein